MAITDFPRTEMDTPVGGFVLMATGGLRAAAGHVDHGKIEGRRIGDYGLMPHSS
jgi:hypothetical protein